MPPVLPTHLHGGQHPALRAGGLLPGLQVWVRGEHLDHLQRGALQEGGGRPGVGRVLSSWSLEGRGTDHGAAAAHRPKRRPRPPLSAQRAAQVPAKLCTASSGRPASGRALSMASEAGCLPLSGSRSCSTGGQAPAMCFRMAARSRTTLGLLALAAASSMRKNTMCCLQQQRATGACKQASKEATAQCRKSSVRFGPCGVASAWLDLRGRLPALCSAQCAHSRHPNMRCRPEKNSGS